MRCGAFLRCHASYFHLFSFLDMFKAIRYYITHHFMQLADFRKVFIPALAVGLVMTACSEESDPVPIGPASLRVIAYTDALTAKGLITTNTLPDQSELGITVVDESGSTYGGLDYTNLFYRADGSGESQTWNPVDGLGAQLTETVGTVYAYYPYQADASFTAVPVDATTETDYLVAKPSDPVNKLAATASLTLKHALAVVRLTVRKNSEFTGTGLFKQATITSTGFGNVGTLNAMTGAVAVTDAGTACFRYCEESLTTTGQDYDIMVVPSETAADMKIALAIDDKSYEVTVPNTTILQGKVCGWTLTVGRSSLIVDGATVAGWGVVNDPNNYVSGPSTVILNQGTVVSYNEVRDPTLYVAYRN